MYKEYDQQVLNSIQTLASQGKATFTEILDVMLIITSIDPTLLQHVPGARDPVSGYVVMHPSWRTLKDRLQALRERFKIAYNAKTKQWRIIDDS